MHPRTRDWPAEITRSVDLIERITAGRAVADYLEDEAMRAAVERKPHIIGENLVRVRDHDPEHVARIAGFRQLIGLRNLLSHAYEDLRHERIWRFTQDDLPRLRRDVAALARASDEERPAADRGPDLDPVR